MSSSSITWSTRPSIEVYTPRMRTGTRPNRRVPRAFAVFGALILCGGDAHAAGQSAAPPRDADATGLTTGTGIIRGRVVSAESDSAAPIRDARVSVRSSSGSPDPVFTDGAGRFEINGVAAGRYTLTAEKTGFVMASPARMAVLNSPTCRPANGSCRRSAAAPTSIKGGRARSPPDSSR